MSAAEDIEEAPPPVTVLLLRSPVPMSKGTDPYHDAFGSFCLPSFASSALESGTSTPLPSLSASGKSSLASTVESGALDLIKTALSQQAAIANNNNNKTSANHASSAAPLPLSATCRRKGKFIHDQPRLMTHHLSYPSDASGDEVEIEYCVTSFPILSHRFVHQQEFVDRLLHGSRSDGSKSATPYRGMIVTSQRAVEAYISAGVKAQDMLRSNNKTSSSSPTQWNRVPFFAVGPATASALRSVPLAPWLRPRLVMGGEATGTGDALARYVIRHFSTPAILDEKSDTATSSQALPLLYLVGDKNASTIPDMLSQASPPLGPIPHEELQVYETSPDPHFAEGCEVLTNTLPSVVSRPPSRRPSNGSMHSRPGSRRPSGGSTTSVDRHPSGALKSANASRKSSSDDLRESSRTASQHSLSHVPSVGTPLGVSTMTSTEVVHPRIDNKSITAAVGGSPQLMASPATIEPEAINPIEEESVLKMLRAKAKAAGHESSGGTDSSTAHNRQTIARPDWIVFFSPSGVNYALEEFRRRKWMPPERATTASSANTSAAATSNTANTEAIGAKTTVTSHSASRKYPRIAVLGSTTRAWMVENLAIEPDAVATKPGPKELKDAIEAVELRLRSRS
jgi:uroporphyrinogen-III synthase